MAAYRTSKSTAWPAEQAFAYMADLRNFASWDPSVASVRKLGDQAIGKGTQFVVTLKNGLALTYQITVWSPPARLVAVASNSWLRSEDTISIGPTQGSSSNVASGSGGAVTGAVTGATVHYDALLTLRGPLQLADRLLQRSFTKLGDAAAAGLAAALQAPPA